jgi:hypothetical protein
MLFQHILDEEARKQAGTITAELEHQGVLYPVAPTDGTYHWKIKQKA